LCQPAAIRLGAIFLRSIKWGVGRRCPLIGQLLPCGARLNRK
jgi:hypothetical protein